jgi:hypothetical protein
MGKYLLNDKEFNVTQDTERIYFTEKSDRKNKVHFSFSKNPEKNRIAKEGMEIFWTEVYQERLI